MKTIAKWILCDGADGVEYHDRQDYCSICAPWWRKYPVCPLHNKKLSYKGFCRDCGKYYELRVI